MTRSAILTLFLCVGFALPALGQSLVAARLIRSKTIISEGDIAVGKVAVAGGLTDPAAVVGMEARSILYPGRPLRPRDIGPPAVVERNQIVTVVYNRGALRIVAEGRSLARGGIGERIRVINTSSRTTISGRITGPGQVEVTP